MAPGLKALYVYVGQQRHRYCLGSMSTHTPLLGPIELFVDLGTVGPWH